MLLDVFPITAIYSNAVVAFMLTNTTELVTNLDLPVPVPVTRASVERVVCAPFTGNVGGVLWLTNGYKFTYSFGHADNMESPHSYFTLQDPDEIPRFFGTIRMSTNEVVALARRTIRQVGYQLPWVEENEPQIILAGVARSDRPKVVPHYRVVWKHRPPDRHTELTARVEINADAKRVEEFWLPSVLHMWDPVPIPQPTPPPAPPQTTKAVPTGGMRVFPLTEAQTKIARPEVMRAITDYAGKLKLPFELPVRDANIADMNLGFSGGQFRALVLLKNGYRFVYRNGRVQSVTVRDSEERQKVSPDISGEPVLDRKAFEGQINFTKEQIIEAARQAVRRLGYEDRDVSLEQPVVFYGGPDTRDGGWSGNNRFFVTWCHPVKGRASGEDYTRIEIEAGTLQIKTLIINSRRLDRPSPVQPEPDQK